MPFQCPVVGQPATTDPQRAQPTAQWSNLTSCPDNQNIRVNVHFVQRNDGSGNFAAFNDGHPCNPSTTTTGYTYARGLIDYANDNMAQNAPLRLAPGNSATPIPKRIRWVLDGVYFDRSTAFRDFYQYSDYGPLCVKADSVINIFLAEEYSWPYSPGTCARDPNISLVHRGFVLASNQADCATKPAAAKLWAVISGPWTDYVLTNSHVWAMAPALNHELCHLLGLNHPFQGLSNCADAPVHPNAQPSSSYFPQCWNLEPSDPNCNAWSKVSNNLMDYNADQSSLSTCQIGMAQDNLNSCLQDRYVYKCSNCLPTRANFDLPESTCGNLTNIWLDGRASFAVSMFKLEIDLVSTTLIWQEWGPHAQHYETTQWRQSGREQLDTVFPFARNTLYRVTLRTYNGCGSAAVRVKYISTDCYEVVAPGGAPSSAKKVSSTSSASRHD